MQRKGRKKRPYYHIVVADSRSKRDGKYIERIGSYNPLTNPATITLDQDKAFEWVMNGAQPSYTARAILRFKGVLYRKHLARGVKKGALTEEQAKNLHEEFMAAKNEKVQARMEKEAALKAEKKSAVLTAPVIEEPKPEEEVVAEEEAGASEEKQEAEESAEATEENTAEAKAEEVKEESKEASAEDEGDNKEEATEENKEDDRGSEAEEKEEEK